MMQKRVKGDLKSKRGSALVVSLCMISMMGTLSLALLQVTLGESQYVERFGNGLMAFHLAEGAVDEAIVSLRGNQGIRSVPQALTDTGAYQATVTPLGQDTYSIDATGTFGGNRNAFGYVERRITAVVEIRKESPFQYAVFSDGELKLTGNAIVDSFDSRKGFFMDLPEQGEKGDVATNSTASDAIEIDGANVKVYGSAWLSDTGNVKKNEKSLLSGGAKPLGQPVSLAPASVPEGQPNDGLFKYAGDSGVHWEYGRVDKFGNDNIFRINDMKFYGGEPWNAPPAQKYWFDEMKVTGNNHVVMSAVPVTVYVTGDVKIDSGQLNPAGLAWGGQPRSTDLVIYVVGNGKVEITGNSWVVGCIYAPESEVKISGHGRVLGAVVGKDVQITGNGRVDYDLAAREVKGEGATAANLLAWQEQGSSSALNTGNGSGTGTGTGGSTPPAGETPPGVGCPSPGETPPGGGNALPGAPPEGGYAPPAESTPGSGYPP